MITGYADANTDDPQTFNVEVGLRNFQGAGSVVKWRPIGNYLNAGFSFTWALEPGAFSFELRYDHPLTSVITPTSVKTTCYHLRLGRGADGLIGYSGLPWSGRITDVDVSGTPGRERFIFTGQCNKIWLQSQYAWVNNLFPPEIQVGLTGKQDVRIGAPDPVMKSYVASVATRNAVPVYVALPVKQPSAWEDIDISSFDSFDDILTWLEDITEPIMFSQARFTQLDELFSQDVARLNLGVSVDLWDGTGTSPTVFNTATLSDLQSIIDTTGQNFLNFSKLASLSSGLWSDTSDRACYVFDTAEVRDNRKVQFRTDAKSQIQDYTSKGTHSKAYKSIVGGKAPSILNDLIEIAANLLITLLIDLLAPGLGLGVTVGDLFDDIFFAYQVFVDNDVRDSIGQDDALPEKFTDNTSAWSLDSYATGQSGLKEWGGSQSITINALSGIPGRGNSFGADDGSATRYRCGDNVHLWDRGNFVEQIVSKVTVSDAPGARRREQPTLGDDSRLKGPWSRLITGVQTLSATSRGAANST